MIELLSIFFAGVGIGYIVGSLLQRRSAYLATERELESMQEQLAVLRGSTTDAPRDSIGAQDPRRKRTMWD